MQTVLDNSKKTKNYQPTLFIGVLGIWILVFQNLGVIPTSKKEVIVVNRIESTIENSVDVNVQRGYVRAYLEGGYIDNVESTLSISIDEVLGRDGAKYYFNN